MADKQTTDLMGCTGFTEAERRGVKRLADRIRFELRCRSGEFNADIRDKQTALRILDEALS